MCLYVYVCACECVGVSFPSACVTKATEAACERKWKAQTINKQTSCKNVTHSSCVGNAKRLGKVGAGPEAPRASALLTPLEAVQLVDEQHPRQLSRSHTRLTAARTAEEHAQLVAGKSPARRREDVIQVFVCRCVCECVCEGVCA